MNELEDVRRRLEGYSLVTAEFFYRMPDYPTLLQTFVWQEIDLPPQYPRLKRFIRFWNKNLDGPILFVRVAYSTLMFERYAIRHLRGDFLIH